MDAVRQSQSSGQPSGHSSTRTALTIAALGIVFGDIGTSPLYAVRETFSPERGIPLDQATILGGISAILWAITLVVSLKYVTLILRADNRGEGGIMALVALASSSVRERPRLFVPITLAGIAGAALFYGDAVLTPAISVLSAVEGLEVGTDALKPWVLPVAVTVLALLFAFQRLGTATVGALFGPICALWFVVLGVVGFMGVLKAPAILTAVNPVHAIGFVTGHGVSSFLVLGAVLLAFTGAEALYADMGHFGKAAVRRAWFGLVFPALALNYLGQGALLLTDPSALQNPFYRQFPEWILYPAIVLATAATVIASQATISGAFSLTRQAMQLGFLPRMRVVQTSAREYGQIYIPAVNWLLLAAVLLAVTGFGSSSALASAYGVAVTATMAIDTLLTFFVIRHGWKYSLALCLAATGFFILIDLLFFASAAVKTAEGGWFPLAVGAAVFTLMTTWRRGREILFVRLRGDSLPLEGFLKSLFSHPPHRVEGTAVFLTATPEVVPNALLHNLKHNKVLHENIVFLTVAIEEVPWVPFGERMTLESLGNGCWRASLRFGFKNRLDVPKTLAGLGREQGLEFDMMSTSFFLSRETVVPAPDNGGMAPWRERLFATLARNAGSAADYFHIPAERVIELGTKVEI